MLAFIPLTHSVFWGALAYVLIGGVGVGTLLTLLFLPALYALWFRVKRAPRVGRACEQERAPAGSASWRNRHRYEYMVLSCEAQRVRGDAMPRVSQEQAKLNRQRVVEVAASCFASDGLHGVGVADIMCPAGLTHGGSTDSSPTRTRWRSRRSTGPSPSTTAATLSPRLRYLDAAHVGAPGYGLPHRGARERRLREAAGPGPITSAVHAGRSGLRRNGRPLLPEGPAERRRRRALASLSTLMGALVLARAVNDPAFATNCWRPRDPPRSRPSWKARLRSSKLLRRNCRRFGAGACVRSDAGSRADWPESGGHRPQHRQIERMPGCSNAQHQDSCGRP